MRRFISISMVAVLAGWLALPVAGASFSPCDMKCCRRAVTPPHCSHMGVMEASGNAESGPEVHANSSACPGKCCVKGRSAHFGLAAPGFASSLLAAQISVPAHSFLNSRLRPDCYSGRAPPHTI
jgi:hypothetical protein